MLVVLLILTILATSTVSVGYGVAMHTLGMSTRLAAAQNRHALDGALLVIGDHWRQGELPMRLLEDGHVRGEVTLGDQLVQYRVWDEATKLRYRGDQPAALWGALDGVADEVTPKAPPSAEDREADREPLLFEEVFRVGLRELNDFYGHMDERPAVGDVLSLWGDGRVNLHTAPEQVIRLRFQDQSETLIESVIQARRYEQTRDLDRLIARMGLNARDSQVVAVRLAARPRTLTVRLACHGPSLRTDAFVVLDVTGSQPRVVLWRDLPAGRSGPEVHETLAFDG